MLSLHADTCALPYCPLGASGTFLPGGGESRTKARRRPIRDMDHVCSLCFVQHTFASYDQLNNCLLRAANPPPPQWTTYGVP